MALHDGYPSASGVADALDIRLGFAGLIVRDAAGVPRTGILPRHTNALVTPTATMNSAVAAFEGVVGRSGQGVVLLPNDGVVNVLHPNAPVANSRYDIVYAKQNDSVSPNVDANSLPVLGVLALGASGSPTLPTYASAKAALDAAPSVLPGAEPLEAVLIPSTATSTSSAGVAYTALHRFTAAAGGVIIFRTTQERDAFAGVDGQRCFVLADSNEYVTVGGVWKALNLANLQTDTTNSLVRTITQIGFGKITGSGSAEASEAVAFPTPFGAIPSIQITHIGFRATGAWNMAGLTAGSPLITAALAPSAAGFTAKLGISGSTLSPTLDWYYCWTAIGVPA